MRACVRVCVCVEESLHAKIISIRPVVSMQHPLVNQSVYKFIHTYLVTDGRTDGQTDTYEYVNIQYIRVHTAYAALAQHRAVKI